MSELIAGIIESILMSFISQKDVKQSSRVVDEWRMDRGAQLLIKELTSEQLTICGKMEMTLK